MIRTENQGADLIVTFEGKGNGIAKDEFAPKLIGKYSDGKMLYGYARLPYVNYIEPILSACAPKFEEADKGWQCNIEVQNFGQVASSSASIKVETIGSEGKRTIIASGKVPTLQAYEKTDLHLASKKIDLEKGKKQEFIITIYSGNNEYSTFRYQLRQE